MRRFSSRPVLFGVLLVISTLLFPAPAGADPAPTATPTWVTNGRVFTILHSPSRTYLAGRFNQIGPNTGFGVRVAAGDGSVLAFPTVDGLVRAAAPDGSGGWYIGGDFSTVGGLDRKRAAHVDGTGAVTAWNPKVNDIVRAIAVDQAAGRVYLGGDFTKARGLSRLHLAAVTATTGGIVSAWDLPADGIVRSLLLDGGTLWAGGTFGVVAGISRSALAAIDPAAGTLLPQDPAVGATPPLPASVEALAPSPDGSTLYLGGSFATVGLEPRVGLAAINTADATPVAWDPQPSAPVQALGVDQATGLVYAGGPFASIGGAARLHAAALDPSTGLATGWDPAVDACFTAADFECATTVSTIEVAADGGSVTLGGAFTTVGGIRRTNVAAVDAVTGAPTSWDPAANAPVHVLASDPTTGDRFLGGELTSAGGRDVGRVVAVDPATGIPDPTFSVDVNNDIQALALSDDGETLYVGGAFNRVHGQVRIRLAAVSVATGALLPWRADAVGGQVYALVSRAGRLFVGGKFMTIGGHDIKRLAVVDTVTAAVDTAFTPNPNNFVSTLALSPDGATLYAGGYFSKIDQQPRARMAAVDAVTGDVTAWSAPNIYPVLTMVVSADGTRVYTAGAGRASIGNRATSWDAVTGARQWETFGGDGNIQALALTSEHLYIGGHFTRLSGSDRARVAAVDPLTGALQPYAPKLNSALGVWAITAAPDALLLGGDFTNVGPAVQQGYAHMPGTP